MHRTWPLCVRVGARVLVDLRGAPGYVWTPVSSSDPQVVVARPRTTDGVATASALAPGRAQLSTTASFSADPHGPPTRLWTVVITVVQ